MTLVRRIPALLLAVTLALAVGIVPAPTLLLAAPAAQASEPAVQGYYESDLIPGVGGNPDLVVGLRLYEDGTAEVISEYQTGEDAIIEVGTWVDNGDETLTLTVIGTTDGDYAAPIDLVFNIAADGALVVPGAENGAFGTAGLTLNPTSIGNSEAILAQIPENALVFQSDILPNESSLGLQLTLAIFDDGSLTLVSDYLSEGDIIVEVGTWTEADDGSLLVTLTGQVPDGDGEVMEYEAPLEFVFATNDDNSLSLVDEGGALFGDAGLTLFPTEATGAAMEAGAAEATTEEATPEATEEATPEATEEAAIEETPAAEEVDAEATPEATPEPDAEAVETTTVITPGITMTDVMTGVSPSGVYISDLLPGQAGSSTFLVTIFYADGSILFSTYPLNGQPPVTEVGTWAGNGDGTYLITATGTLTEEYEKPFTVDFTMDDEGIVTISGVPLYPLEKIDLAGAPILVSEFASDLITDTIDLTHTLTLMVYDDASAELMTDYLDEDAPTTQSGIWVLDEGTEQLLLTLTRDDEGDYEEPIEWTFDILADGTLSLANDVDGYYGADGLLLLPITDTVASDEAAMMDAAAMAEDTPEATTEPTDAAATGEEAAAIEGAQLFQSEVLPAASGPGLQLTLGLLDDGLAAIDYDYLNDEDVITNTGEWVDNGDGTITITFTEGPNGTLELPVEMVFELDDEGNLVITDASEESSGLINTVLAPVVLE